MLTKSDQHHVAKLEASELDRLRAVNAELLAALKDWLWYADGALSEFDLEVCDSEKLCPRCEDVGCINLKIRTARALAAKAEQS